MATSAQTIWNQSSPSSAESRRVSSMANSTGQNSSANGSSTSIATNDFLTLLVTEMKNQDPTATTDPNEYVNQLVQVNSLQQLISINETLQKGLSTVKSTDSATGPGSENRLTSSLKPPGAGESYLSTKAVTGRVAAGTNRPGATAAAQRIATALTSK